MNNEKEKWDIVIKPKRGLFDLNLKQIVDYRDLLSLFVLRDITVTYKQTILGPLWFFIQPIFTTVIYIFVFGNIAKLSTDGIPKPLFYLSGVVMWSYFQETFNQTSNTFVANSQVFGKVFFPRLISPLSKIVSSFVKFLIQFVLFLGVYFYFLANGADIQASWHVALVPIFLLMMASIGLGFGLIISSLTTKYKDLKFLVQFGVQLLMYATPVIYPLSTITNEKAKFLIQLNPITHILEGFKFSFLGAGSFSFPWLAYTAAWSILILFIGILVFNKTEKSFIDTV